MTQQMISRSHARKIAIGRQLAPNSPFATGKEGVAQVVEHLGYVQIDTISVIERAHHHTLWTRLPDYEPGSLHDLLAVDRRIFEYWGHAASYLPMSDYRYYMPRMRRAAETTSAWARNRQERAGHLLEPVLARIRAEGPLGSKDFEPAPGAKSGTWWDWKPAKVALELLFTRGDLMVSERRNFQRRYDLTERVLPPDVDTRVPDAGQLGRFLVRRALNAYGIARDRDIRDHIRSADLETVRQALAELSESGEVISVVVEGDPDAHYYADCRLVEERVQEITESDAVRLLSPFDNLIIQRDRLRRLFGFDYTLECYVPAAKRKYGYFVLPILWGERFVGRLDPKADRKRRRLIVRNLFFEPDLVAFDRFLPPFSAKLWSLAAFNGCDDIVIEQVSPPELAEAVRASLQTGPTQSQ